MTNLIKTINIGFDLYFCLYITVTAQNKLLTTHGVRTYGLSDSFTVYKASLPSFYFYNYYKV